MSKMYKSKILAILGIFAVFLTIIQLNTEAQVGCTLTIDNIRFENNPILAGAQNKIYTTIKNTSGFDCTGFMNISYSVAGNDFDIPGNSYLVVRDSSDTTFSSFTPTIAGNATFFVSLRGSSGQTVETNASVLIDQDTDGDGILDSIDTDDDNDGMPDEWENAYGLNSKSSSDRDLDNDGDGLTNFEEFEFNSNPNEADTDGDGLNDKEEKLLGTNPNNVDTDGDGLNDKIEVENGLDPKNPDDAREDLDGDGLTNIEEIKIGTFLNNPDSDGDGLLDGVEVNELKTNPLEKDTDGDGMPDGWEVEYGLDPIDASDSTEDPDKDGYNNYQEYLNNTNPNESDLPNIDQSNINIDKDPSKIDSDLDYLSDKEEESIGTKKTNPDTDGDGLLDGYEVYVTKTNPLLFDTDGDGMPDGYEVLFNLDPFIKNDSEDNDGDGLTNIEEFKNGSDPTDSNNNKKIENYKLLDTDGDGIPDLTEIQFELDPTFDDSELDLDGDGLSNLFEYENGLLPNRFDSDLDGFDDGFEANNQCFNPRISEVLNDHDLDNIPSIDEIKIHNTDPCKKSTYWLLRDDVFINLKRVWWVLVLLALIGLGAWYYKKRYKKVQQKIENSVLDVDS